MSKQKIVKLIIRKRSFLLFELLVSLSLIVLCLFPLIKIHASMRKTDQKQLTAMQMERIAQEAFCKLKIELYKNAHNWDRLIKEEIRGELGPYKIVTGLDMTQEVVGSYIINPFKHTPKTEKTGLVVKINLKFSEVEKFQRTLYLESRKPS